VRAPYYNEVADILFPVTQVKAREEGLWESIRSSHQQDGATRMHIQAARFFMATGHYGTAEFYARCACRTQANCAEARYLLALAIARRGAEHNSGDLHEECEQPPVVAAPVCGPAGVCAACKECKVCKENGCCCAAKGCAGCPECGKVKGCCATECGCNKDGGCGPDCCCGMAAAASACNPQRLVSIRMVWTAGVVAAQAPRTCVCPCVPAQATRAIVIHSMPVPARNVQLTTGEHCLRLVSGQFEATCDQLQHVGGDRVLLQGHVCLVFRMADHPARIVADQIMLNVKDGSYEVMPPAVRFEVVPNVVPARVVPGSPGMFGSPGAGGLNGIR
jgi:hypothetical protein